MLRLVWLHALLDEVELVAQGLVAVSHADLGHVGLTDVVALWAFLEVVLTQEVALLLRRRRNGQACIWCERKIGCTSNVAPLSGLCGDLKCRNTSSSFNVCRYEKQDLSFRRFIKWVFKKAPGLVRRHAGVWVCYLVRHCALQNAVPGDLTHVAGTELEDLGCNGVLLHQGLLWT